MAAAREFTVLLTQQHRQLRLVRPQLSDLPIIEVGKLKCLKRPVGILLQHQQVKHTDQITLDQIDQHLPNLPVEPCCRELDHNPVDRPSSSTPSTSSIDI